MLHCLISSTSLFLEILILYVKVVISLIETFMRFIIPVRRKSVSGEIVLVTGAGHGIGKQLAIKFAKLGAKLVLLDINQENNDAVAQEIRENGGVAHSYRCDVSDEKQIEAIARQIKQEIGDVTMLINNAGIMHAIPLLSLNNQQIRRTMDINAVAQMWTIRQFLPGMLNLGHGHIVSIASQAGLMGSPYLVDYCSSKYACVGIMDALEEELFLMNKEGSIHLTTICPLGIKTGLIHQVNTRFPSLFPFMEVDGVTDQMVDAILRNKRFVPLPTSFGVLCYFISPLPRKAKRLILHFLSYSVEPHIDMNEVKY